MPAPLTRLTVTNVRSLAHVDIHFQSGAPLVVLGENGAGKSSLVEAIEILRKTARPNFVEDLREVHGLRFIRAGSPTALVSAELGGNLVYELGVGFDDERPRIFHEQLRELDSGREFVTTEKHGRRQVRLDEQSTQSVTERDTVIGTAGRFASGDHSIRAAFNALESIQVHLPFSLGPLWGRRERKLLSAIRSSTPMYEASRLERHGDNLAAAFHELKNGESANWDWAQRWVRRGLGDAVQSVNVKLDSSGGGVVALKYTGVEQEVRADSLSDGTLAWLGHVALAALARRNKPSAVVFDEPEVHLHPGLQATLAELYAELAESCPVLLATQSDRIVDALPSPEASVVLCELDEQRATKLYRPEPGQLQKWLAKHRFADLRYDRLEDRYFTVPMVAERKE